VNWSRIGGWIGIAALIAIAVVLLMMIFFGGVLA
jgi:hypothetical protein